MPVTSWPSKTTCPRMGLYTPESILNKVVLPAPFGPMTDKMPPGFRLKPGGILRSEEHTSELQSRGHLVCRLLLEKRKRNEYRAPRRPQRTSRDQRRPPTNSARS